ncbi:hypothetical protein XELAEV_18030681mg [Xenopus laevis]|uniref:Immunoglobulin subtype domain-containing protein n=1 Tax=Xenopus laevis TaxID=8355 RepID=A0A974CMR0_XENLA|nr:hypothetical protein XELAEV_18030681mg [Xenopus laevis]
MMMLIGLLLSCQPASALKRFTLFRHKLTLKAHTRNLIPCRFYADHAIDPSVLQLEWGKVPVGGGKYTPLIHLYGEKEQTFHENSNKYQLFVSLVPTGNCTLIINPTETTDSGVYEFMMKVDDIVFMPASKIKIDVLEAKETSTESRAMRAKEQTTTAATTTTIMTTTEPPATNSSAKKAAVIVVMVMGTILVITSILSGVGIYLYVKLKRKVESGDVENPTVSTPVAQSQSKPSLEIENETLVNAEEETGEEEETDKEETNEEEETDKEESNEEEENEEEENEEEEIEEEENEEEEIEEESET